MAVQEVEGIRCPHCGGVLKLTLHPTGYGWQFVSTAGTMRDPGSASCH